MCAWLCSICLGLPYVAWLAALQRQRVMTKHGVAAADEEAWATACYPCNLLQMHALLQQQHQQQPSLVQPHQAQQQEQASVPLRAPRVQQMTGTAESADHRSSVGPALPPTRCVPTQTPKPSIHATAGTARPLQNLLMLGCITAFGPALLQHACSMCV